MELRQVRYFLVVAEERSFTRAAQRLQIVQSAVSQQVRRLERELGVALFDRSTRRVDLTAAGSRLVPAARRLLAAESRAKAAVREADAPVVLRLGTASGLGERLQAALRTLRDDHGIGVDLVRLPTRDRLRRLVDGTLDAAVVRCAPDSVPPAGVRWSPLGADPLVVVVAVDHPLAGRDPLPLAALAGFPFRIAGERDSELVRTVERGCLAAGFEPVVAGAAAGSEQDLLAAIATGPPSWSAYFRSRAAGLNAGTLGVRFLDVEGDPLRVPAMIAVRRGTLDVSTRQLVATLREA